MSRWLIGMALSLTLSSCGSAPQGPESSPAPLDSGSVAGTPAPGEGASPPANPYVNPGLGEPTVEEFHSNYKYPNFIVSLEDGIKYIERTEGAGGSMVKASARFIDELAKKDSRFDQFRFDEGLEYLVHRPAILAFYSESAARQAILNYLRNLGLR